MEKIYDMIVLGGGPAGYTAAMYAARSALSTLVLEKLSAGGQMALTEKIDNYPGMEEGIDGFLLGEKMQKSAERVGAVTETAEVYEAKLSSLVKTLKTDVGIFHAYTVVVATGAMPRALGIPGEEALRGRGVHYCAACDGAFYRRDTLRAAKIYHESLFSASNVEFCQNRTVSALLYGDRLTGLRLQDTMNGEESVLSCDGVFISVGRTPSSKLFEKELTLDQAGYIAADESTRTTLPGVFAAGHERTMALRQVITSAADGAAAVHYAEAYLAQNH